LETGKQDLRGGSGSVAEFEAETVAEICEYMNDEQAATCLFIVQGPGATPQATSARMVGFDTDAVLFDVGAPAGEHTRVRIDWPYPIDTRPQVREALFALLDIASRMR
jgi:hypothetical protein